MFAFFRLLSSFFFQYWSRDMYYSLCEMLREVEKKETNKVR